MSFIRVAHKVLITHPEVPSVAIDLLKNNNCNIVICENVPPQRSEILQKIRGVDALFWAHCDPLNEEILNTAGKALKAVSTMSSGVDYVDLEAFYRRRIPLGHTPDVVKNSVADLAIGLMISAGRLFHAGRIEIDNSLWQTGRIDWLMGQEIGGSTIGIFGFGGIGQSIAKRLQCWDIKKILYTTRNCKNNDSELNATHVSFEELLKESDFLIVACPLTVDTRQKFNASAFQKMKKNSVFVNVARGEIVNQTDLYNALKDQQIFAAGLDVMTPEPLPANDPLLSLPNCIVTPHLGTQTVQTTAGMSLLAANNIINALNGNKMIAAVYELK